MPAERETDARLPTLSVGVPVYNGESTVRNALDSLLAQTFTDFEIIISDNASTDSTPEICREYAAKDARIRYIRQPHNLGAAKNFDFLVREARGEFFMWAAHDDTRLPDHIKKLMDAHNSRHYLLVSSEFLVFDKDGIEIPRPPVAADIGEGSRARVFKRFMCLHHNAGYKASIVYGIFRRHELLNKPFETDGKLVESTHNVGGDLLLLYRTLAEGPIHHLSEVTWYTCRPYRSQDRFDTPCKGSTSPLRFFASRFAKRLGYIGQIGEYTRIIDSIINSNWSGLTAYQLRTLNKLNAVKIACAYVSPLPYLNVASVRSAARLILKSVRP